MGLLWGNHTALLIFISKSSLGKCPLEIQDGMICMCARLDTYICISVCTQTSVSNDCPGVSRLSPFVLPPASLQLNLIGAQTEPACLLDVFKWLC